MAFKLNAADLEFVLKQIKISEAHTNGTALTEIRLDADGAVITDRAWYTGASFDPTFARAIPDAKTPFGLRTVDGSYNNLVEGREFWGAADQPMPRLLDAGAYLNDADGDSVTFGTPTSPVNFVNGNYAPGTPTAIGPGSVADADPRIISNLIVDMSLANPAAIVAALTFAGSEQIHGSSGDLQAIRAGEATWGPQLDVLRDPLASAADKEAAQNAVNAFLAPYDIEVDGTGSVRIPNIAPDEGLSAPFNSWMTFFGQFFDHGLDLITKGGAGTVYIPLQPDDPLYVEGSPSNFMVLTRATPNGDSHTNTTTSWVDQNQTYTSNASHQVFLREYARDGDGDVVATGKLLDGKIVEGTVTSKNGLPTWADVKAQALDMLGLKLSNVHVHEVPLLATDAYGMYERGPNGYAQVLVEVVHAGGTSVVKVEGKLGGLDLLNITAADLPAGHGMTGITDIGALGTRHAFLDDIAHNAVPTNAAGAALPADGDSAVGYSGGVDGRGRNTSYDDEMLDRHFITGDGRGNENIGLTAVHHVFHSEHNRQVDSQKLTILQSGDLGFINDWLNTDIAGLPTNFQSLSALDQLAYANSLNWDGERLFQAGRFATEMQYQHLVFEEFGRKIQPNIDPFVFNSVTDIDPSIFAEFANVVYRFGHSMLTDAMPRVFLDENGNVSSRDDMGLIAAFLNPIEFNTLAGGQITAEEAAGAIVRGMTSERGNEIDEFVTGALRNSLLGIPLDLAAINIARGRDTNMPTLNEAREQLYAATSSTFLEPYDSWVEFAANLKNPMSVVNFIAAYGTHSSITSVDTVEEKRDAAMALVLGVPTGTATTVPADRTEFLNGLNTIGGTNWSTTETGLNTIDLWIGGLAEKKMPFGGFLGSTFNAVFEAQMEALQDGDRFYYLTRTQGQNFLNELEQNSFAKMIMANTDIANPGADGIRGTDDDIVTRHIGVDSFADYDYVFEVNAANQEDYDDDNLSASGVDPVGNDPILEAIGLGKVIRNDPGTAGPDQNYFRTFGGEHVVVGGTNQADTIITDFGDDGIWGDGGDDRIESGAGVDLVNGGAGNDIITDSGDSGDFIKGDAGNDVIANSNGLDILMGGTGKDTVFVGVDDTEVFGGEGDDFILGGAGVDFLMGNEGDDWIEAGDGFDTTAGDNSELFFNSTILGHDVMFAGGDEHDFDAESGDDIMVQGESVMRNEGMFGYDWVSYQDSRIAADADMQVRIFTTDAEDILRNRFDQVEALSGSDLDDVLRGDSRTNVADPNVDPADPPTPDLPETRMDNSELSHAGVDRIAGLKDVLGSWLRAEGPVGSDRETTIAFEDGNIILGGGGSDLIEGRGGNDIIDGDRALNVRIRITADGASNVSTAQIATIDSLTHRFTTAEVTAWANAITDPVLKANVLSWAGKSVSELMIARIITPGQLHIVREIIDAGGTGTDTAVYWDALDTYSFASTDDALLVSHTGFDEANRPAGTNLVSDGTDMVRNVEALRFDNAGAGGPAVTLGVIEGTSAGQTITGSNNAEIILGFGGDDTLNGQGGNDILLGGSGADTLNGGEGNDTLNGGTGSDTATYADNFDNSSFGSSTGTTAWDPDWVEQNDDNDADSGQIRIDDDVANVLRFHGGTGATYNGAQITRTMDLSGATSATISYSSNADGLDPGETVTVQFAADGETFVTLQTISGETGDAPQSFTVTGPFEADAAIRFVTTAISATNEGVSINNLAISFTKPGLNGGVDTLNGGNGDDTYVINLGDGNDVIQEQGGNDRLVVGPGTLTGLNAFEGASSDLLVQFNGQQVTVTDHFATTGEVVETINLDGATFAGYAFDGDYALSTDDNGDRTAAAGVNTLIAGTTGGNDLIGDTGDDLLFGHDGNDNLDGGAGDDLLVGGAGTDSLVGGIGADTMAGGAGGDTYVVDDAGDAVVEDAAAGTDTVQTALATYTLTANVENLTYTGAAAFAGTGNELDNVLTGGAGIDTLTGLAGNDTYVVTAGDVIVEAELGGTDTVQSAASYTLGANLENLALTGTGAINGTGNSLGNTITGNGGANQLFGGGGNDAINGGDGVDFIDGGTGDDTLNGGTGNDADIIVGGDGNDTINVSDGNDIVRYTASNFGADVITNFDANAAGGGQDQIDLGALGITAANFAARVTAAAGTGADAGDTIITVRNADTTVAGTIRVDGVTVGTGTAQLQMTATSTDFILAAGPPAPVGGATIGANTITGNGSANTIDGLGGNDTLNGAGGNDELFGSEGADTLNGGDGNDTLTGGTGSDTGTYVDTFATASYANNNGTLPWVSNWTEGGGETTSATGGDIGITGGRLAFVAGIDGGETIQRSIDLAGATTATLSFSYEPDDLDAGEQVIVEAFNGSTWSQLGAALGGDSATQNFSAPLTAAHTAIRFRAVGNFETGENFYIDNVTVTTTAPGLNAGADTINGDAGDDTIVWNANASGATDGRDIINGGSEGSGGDTLVINGNGSAEQYRIYTLTAWAAVAGNSIASFAGRTPEIVITRGGTGFANVIAELTEIEEIRINGSDPAGTSGSAGNDTFEVIGDFSGTSLRPNTITIAGSAGNDTVDISSLNSAHRIVFKSNGGNDTIVGTLRPQDVVELPQGAATSSTDTSGVTTLTDGTHTVSITPSEDDDEEDADDDAPGGGDVDDNGAGSGAGNGGSALPYIVYIGTGRADIVAGGTGDDRLSGAEGNDKLSGGAGDDLLMGEAGNDKLSGGIGDDTLRGGDGADSLNGDAGDDHIFGGEGRDVINAGDGHDVIFAAVGDGNDVVRGGGGSDTIDFSQITANLNIDLRRGRSDSNETGRDSLSSIENVKGGAGADRIVASTEVNVLDGGSGADTFVFTSADSANGDRIEGFAEGDKVDLTAFMPKLDAGDFIDGSATFGLAGQVRLTTDGLDTIIEGNTDRDSSAEFMITVVGRTLTSSDFV
jgi:Ca2+-binding RTX toxin-like protein